MEWTKIDNEVDREKDSMEIFEHLSKILQEQYLKTNPVTFIPGKGFYKTAGEVFQGYGIKIDMKPEKDTKHHLPHIHISNGNGQHVSVGLNGDILAGHCDSRTLLKIKEFIDLNKNILSEMWDYINSGKSLKSLKPKIIAIN